MTQCPICGQTSCYPSGPHSGRPCPTQTGATTQRKWPLMPSMRTCPRVVTVGRSLGGVTEHDELDIREVVA